MASGFGHENKVKSTSLCDCNSMITTNLLLSTRFVPGHGKAVDWWAIGILIYEMLAGYPPFYDENPFGIYQKILAGKIDFPKHFDPNAKVRPPFVSSSFVVTSPLLCLHVYLSSVLFGFCLILLVVPSRILPAFFPTEG